jgi:hypothetical protein
MVMLIKKLMIVCLVMMLLTSCLGNKTEYVQVRLDKSPEDTKGTLRPAKRQKILVARDNGANQETKAGKIEIGPEYILTFENDFVKITQGAKAYNDAKKKLTEYLKEGKISQEIYNSVIEK